MEYRRTEQNDRDRSGVGSTSIKKKIKDVENKN